MGCPGAVTELCQIVGVEGERDLGTSRLLLSIQGLSRRCSLPPSHARSARRLLHLCAIPVPEHQLRVTGERKAHQTGTSVHSIQPKKGGLTLCVCQHIKITPNAIKQVHLYHRCAVAPDKMSTALTKAAKSGVPIPSIPSISSHPIPSRPAVPRGTAAHLSLSTLLKPGKMCRKLLFLSSFGWLFVLLMEPLSRRLRNPCGVRQEY